MPSASAISRVVSPSRCRVTTWRTVTRNPSITGSPPQTPSSRAMCGCSVWAASAMRLPSEGGTQPFANVAGGRGPGQLRLLAGEGVTRSSGLLSEPVTDHLLEGEVEHLLVTQVGKDHP